MKITFLGTGTSHGVPVIGCTCEVCISTDKRDNRLRSSILIETNTKQYFVVDTGPDFREQMLRAKPPRLDAVIFTHEHKDHTAGLDDVRSFNFWQDEPIDVYAHPRVQQNLRKTYDYIFHEKTYPGIPQINLHTINNNEPFSIGDTEIIPIEVMHFKLPVLGFRFGNFTYITDANYIAEEEREKIYGSEVLVLNALRIGPHISHFSLSEALQVAEELKVPQVYFLHISHQLGLHAEVEKNLPSGIHLAYDGLQIELNPLAKAERQ